MFVLIMTHATSPANQKKMSQLHLALTEIMGEILQRGFHGTADLEVSVQDGTIQHIRRRVERVMK